MQSLLISKVSLERFKLPSLTRDILSNRLGKGAQGSVYQHKINNKVYAIKVLSSDDWEYEDEFIDDSIWQLEVISHIKSLNLQKGMHFYGYDIITEDNTIYIMIVMDFLGNQGDLYDYIQKDKFWTKTDTIQNKYSFKKKGTSNYINYTMDKSEKIKITKQMVDAVREIHSERVGIIHGDIKTNNIMYSNKDGNQTIYLIDFGASLYYDKNNKLLTTECTHGTLGYSSPEDYLHFLLGKPSDIYSLAVSIIEVWCGKIWIESEEFKGCRNEVLKALRMVERNDIEVGLILRKCIEMDSSRRPDILKIYNYFNTIFNDDRI
tara:strand:- start:1978 stop:2937 length:960 start_codon:yes stop_codon:yes gene_type:complete